MPRQPMEDRTGETFNHLTVIDQIMRERSDAGRSTYFVCSCSCGKTKTIRAVDVTSGRTESCGHLRYGK